MKKICICTTVSITMRTFVVETAKYLHEKCGYDITLICNADKSFEKNLPSYIHFIPVNMSRGLDIAGIKAIFEFIKIFKREKFDIVQYSTPNAACYASIAARICKVPIRLYCQWGIRYVGMNGILRKIFKFIEKIICNNSTDIRAVSYLNKSFAVAEGLYQESKALVVGNGGTIGVDLSLYDISKKEEYNFFIRKKYNIDREDFVYGFVGRISADKGCIELFNAFQKITKSESKVKLLIVGPVEDNCGVPLKILDWARNSKQVIMTGIVNNAKMNEYYSAMNVLVHPTYREGFGMVIQEAGALAIPVITTNIPGASEVMENGISSVHVKVKDTEELVIAMESFIKDKNKAIKYGKAAYNRTLSLYERSIMLENQRKDYERLLETEKKIILSDKKVRIDAFSSNIKIEYVTIKTLEKYNNNNNVIAIIGSRAMAIKAINMKLEGLKLFQLTSAGFDGVPYKEYSKKNILVANAGSVYSVPIAETVIFGILSIAKKLHSNPNNRHIKIQRNYNTITELANKNILIMGAGNIGTAIANRLSGFEMNIDGYDPFCIEKPEYRKIIRSRKELVSLINEYDYIVSTLPDNNQTKEFINAELFNNMKKTSIIINVGRRATFNENDFYQVLKKKRIGGAVLDMFEKFPNPIQNKFRRLSNVIVLPGVAAISQEVRERLQKHIITNIIKLLNGNELINVINKDFK